MYPNHLYHRYNNPYYPETYHHTIPFHEARFYPEIYDERIFGQFHPSMGPPPGTPGFPSTGQGPETSSGAPTTPPPSFVPTQTQQPGTFAVDPGSIRGCLFRFTYVWLRNFQQFWFYPTFVGRTSVSGFRWTGFRWVFFGISLQQIQSFTCV